MAKKQTVQVQSLESIYQVWGWILLFWSLYRYFFTFPEHVDELLIKPAVFILPVLWFVLKKEKRTLESIGITSKHVLQGVYIGVGFGFLFVLEGIFATMLKSGTLSLTPLASLEQYGIIPFLVLSLATAFSEEVLNRGFLFSRIYERTKNLTYAVSVATILFVLLHVPILVTTLNLHGVVLVFFFITNMLLGVINNVLFFKTKSLVSPILVHAFWNMAIALYL